MIGKYVYGEWLVPIVDYYKIIKKNEVTYEILMPTIISIVVTGVCFYAEGLLTSLLKLRDILPATLAILIGFSITCITILISSNNANIEAVKERKTDNRIIDGQIINMYQWFLIMFIYSLLVQVFLLMLVFFTAFILRVYSECWFMAILLFAEVYYTLHILFLLIRNISNFYFVFFKPR